MGPRRALPVLVLPATLSFFTLLFASTGVAGRPGRKGSQELQHATGVVNVEVPVRVFDGEVFIDNLTLDDFAISEDGRPQSPVALYLIRKSDVLKAEARGTFPTDQPAPKTQRNIVILFEVNDPDPKLDDAVDYFFDQVYLPTDRVNIATPQKTYHLKPETLAHVPRTEIARQLKAQLRKDILAGAMEYKLLLRTIRELNRFPVDDDLREHMVMDVVRQLRDRLDIEESRLRQAAANLKALEGQKHVFLFYQRERIVLPLVSDFALSELYRSLSFDPKTVERLFADASLAIHFIYLTQTTTGTLEVQDQRREDGLRTRDVSANIYAAFREMSQVTGGLTEATGNPLAAFKKAVTASENYYLLYYVPKDYKADGKFHEIKVEVKGKRYRVTHRAGYFAN